MRLLAAPKSAHVPFAELTSDKGAFSPQTLARLHKCVLHLF